MTEWYYTVGSEQRGPVSQADLQRLAADGTLLQNDLVWREGLTDWVAATAAPGLNCAWSGPPPLRPGTAPSVDDSKRLTAGILALLLGALGVHKFYLGYNTAGLIMLLVTLLTCGFGGIVIHVIALVEGVIYLCKSPADFQREYMIGQRAWF